MRTQFLMTRPWLTGDSAEAIMERNRGAGPGFDLWRVGLSALVILLHSHQVSYGHAAYLATGPFGPVFASILPIFFGLSGFLVTGSALRTRSVRIFLTFRVLRIIPALVTEVTLAALILGPLLTTVPLADYFSDARFFRYFGNIVGWIHFELPGVFTANPRPGTVNQNLWTLHPELECYLLMAVLMATRLIYDRTLTTLLLGVATSVGIAANVGFDMFELNGTYPGPVLVYYFLCGVVAFHWRRHIIVNPWLFVAAVVAAYALLTLRHNTFFVEPLLIYIMIYVGMVRLPRVGFLQRGDYSYGMYLYAYPIQQTLVLLFPGTREWYYNFCLSIALALGVAALSWHLVEKPALALKRFVKGRPPAIGSTTEPQSPT